MLRTLSNVSYRRPNCGVHLPAEQAALIVNAAHLGSRRLTPSLFATLRFVLFDVFEINTMADPMTTGGKD